jgi:peroxiredoxin Q/BCP
MRKLLSAPLAAVVLALALPASGEDAIPGPAVGDFFPLSIAAEDQAGERRTLGELAGEQGLVLAFVRSADWCPFCKSQLADLNRRSPEFEQLGLNVVSISVDEVAEIAAFAQAQDIGYTMLADPGGDINGDLGIRDEQYPVGSAAFGVPRPVLYIIDTNATVRAVYMEPTYRTRPDLDIVLRDVQALELE